ncbi:unnamed protein product [Ilex paraguariensis]|uniref:Cyclic nucleotide-binding domain-containing protein n=1 Tax=Ilex paraguariensis TaxID=185542 RepID=A0ABC8TUL4_9AQUA
MRNGRVSVQSSKQSNPPTEPTPLSPNLSTMNFGNSKSVRFKDDLETTEFATPEKGSLFKLTSVMNGILTPKSCLKNTEAGTTGKPFKEKKLLRVFSEDYDVVQRIILDPRGTVVNNWNKCFLVACMISLFVDPLFFYFPEVKKDMCMDASVPLEIGLTFIRSVVDAFYVIQIFVRFRTAYVAPSSRVFGRGELVIDSTKIASRYLRRDFWLDMLAALPFPQVTTSNNFSLVLIWGAIPCLRGSRMINVKIVLRLVIICQFQLRLYLIFPLSSQIIKNTGVVVEAAWVGAAYNLILYLLASHVSFYFDSQFCETLNYYPCKTVEAFYSQNQCSNTYALRRHVRYMILHEFCFGILKAIDRQEQCWKEVCNQQHPSCQYWYFDCRTMYDSGRAAWFNSSNISSLCGAAGDFQFGIYGDAVFFDVTSSNFLSKYLYCLWWGLRSLSSIGQNLSTSTYKGENIFAIIIAILGLVFFALLIGNMQVSIAIAKTFLQSTTVRLEEWRVKRTDTEEWMRHRQLPHELRQCVRNYDLYKWVTTRGVDEEVILEGLPLDLRRDIKRHLCLDLVRRVPLFDQMDECMLDAICERLKPVLCTPVTCLVREGDPVNEMLFIVRGHLDSYTTDGGRTGFLNSCRIGPGDFCGEELLTWALDPHPSVILPSSTRTVRALSEVEAFAFISEDVKFVASQFRKLHSKQMRHTFRFHSHQWRTWAACFIQAAWFRYKRRIEAARLKAKEGRVSPPPEPAVEQTGMSLPLKASELAMYAATLAASNRKGGSKRGISEFDLLSSLQKPVEPDFSIDDK